jgi:hypothetical protein
MRLTYLHLSLHHTILHDQTVPWFTSFPTFHIALPHISPVCAFHRLCTAVLVDEASMLDIQLAAALTRALPDGCQLLLVGDPHQLPPVGPGAVLQDLIDSGIVPRVSPRVCWGYSGHC